jgi:adenylate cyclase
MKELLVMIGVVLGSLLTAFVLSRLIRYLYLCRLHEKSKLSTRAQKIAAVTLAYAIGGLALASIPYIHSTHVVTIIALIACGLLCIILFFIDRRSQRHLTFKPLKIPRYVTTIFLAALVASVAVYLWPPNPKTNLLFTPLHDVEWNGYDMLFMLRSYDTVPVDPRIVVLGFDEQSENSLGIYWPAPRTMHAKVLDRLMKAGAEVVIFDILFDTPSSNPKDDAAFDAALKHARKVVLTFMFNRDTVNQMKGLKTPYYDDKVDFEANARTGFANVDREKAGGAKLFTRRYLPVTYSEADGAWLPSLSVAAYLALKDIPDSKIKVTKDRISLGDNFIPRTGPTGIDPVDDSELPTAYVNFPANHVPTIKYESILDENFEKSPYFKQLNGAIVFIGITGTELAKFENEQFTTSASHYVVGESRSRGTTVIPGVELHAQFLNTLLNHAYNYMTPPWALWLLVFIFSLLATHAVRSYMNWRGPVFLAAAVILYLLTSVFSFTYLHYHIPWVIPSVLIFATAALMAWVERGSMRKKWSGYVSPAVMQIIMQQEEGLGAQRHVGSVIFGDIRNFTGFSEAHEPEVVVRLLNRHFEKMTKIIYEDGGTIDKFLGDGILVVFGVPLPQEDAALRAVRVAWKSREAALEAIIDEDGQSYVLATGFGITTGPLVAGHVGSQARHEFTIIGDTVNLSSRLQGVTGKPDVIIDVPTYELVRDHVEIEHLGEVTLKGKSQPIACMKVTAWYDTPKSAESADDAEKTGETAAEKMVAQ